MLLRELNRSKTVFLAAFIVEVMVGCGPGHGPDATKVRVNSGLQNFVQDPGFEEGTPDVALTGFSRPWVGEEAGEVVIRRDGTAHGGAQHATMVGDTAQLMQMVGLSPNTAYRVSAWVGGTPGIDQHPATSLDYRSLRRA